MDKKITELEGCEREMEITLTHYEIQPYIENKYFELLPKLEMKGFRKGRVPFNLVKRLYGKQIEQESLEEASNEIFKKIITDDKIKVVGKATLKEIKDADTGKTFVISYETLPDFELGEYRGLSINEKVHRVSDEEIEHALEHLLIEHGEKVSAESIEGKLFKVYIAYNKVDEATGLPLVGGAEEKEIELYEHNINPNLLDEFMHRKVDDEFNYLPAPNDIFPANEMVNITIDDIEQIIPAEPTEEMAKKLSGGKFETMEDYKQEIGFILQENWDKASREDMEDQVMHHLIDLHSFPVPKFLTMEVARDMTREAIQRIGYKLTDEMDKRIDEISGNFLPAAEPTVKWELIKNKIIEKEDLKVEDFDIDNMAETEAAHYDVDVEQIKSLIANNEEIKHNILSKKVLDIILDFAITTEVEDEEEFHTHLHEHSEAEHSEPAEINTDKVSENDEIISESENKEEN